MPGACLNAPLQVITIPTPRTRDITWIVHRAQVDEADADAKELSQGDRLEDSDLRTVGPVDIQDSRCRHTGTPGYRPLLIRGAVFAHREHLDGCIVQSRAV